MDEKALDVLSRIKDILSLSYEQLFIIGFVTLGIVLIPEKWLVIANLSDFRESISPYIGGVSIIAWLWLIGRVIFDMIGMGGETFFERRFIKKYLRNLTEIEKAYLWNYIRNQTRTVAFHYNDGVVSGLEQKGIIYRSTSLGKSGPTAMFDYNMRDWTYDYISENIELLGEMPEDEVGTNPWGV